jgi:hypothetical protein
MTVNFQYSDAKKFVHAFLTHVHGLSSLGLPVDKTALAMFNKLCEKGETPRFKKFLGELISEILEVSSGWGVEKIKEADRLLSLADSPTLSDARIRHSKKIRKVLSKGSVANVNEYYECKAVVDSVSPLFSPDERAEIEKAMMSFEERLKG